MSGFEKVYKQGGSQRGRNMKKVKELYFVWLLILFVEIIWLYIVEDKSNTAGDLSVVITVIAVTLTVGAVGLKVFSND